MFRSRRLRSLKLTEYTLLMGLFLTSPIFGGLCQIDILNEKNSGEKIRLKFISKLNSKKQCQVLARMHRPNFNPDQVKLKLVHYRWVGSKSSLAKRSKSLKRRRSTQF